jgi:molybdopterin biosynthesis enzyme
VLPRLTPEIVVYGRPRGHLLTGNEIVAPGQPLRPGAVYDPTPRSSARPEELGGVAVHLGVIPATKRRWRARSHEVCNAIS